MTISGPTQEGSKGRKAKRKKGQKEERPKGRKGGTKYE
jgi:hypothetical protein